MNFFEEQGLNLHFGSHSKSGVSGVADVTSKEINRLENPNVTPKHRDLEPSKLFETPKHPKHTSHPKRDIPEKASTTWDSRFIWERIQRGERVRIWSKVLGEYVLWVRDEVIRACATREHPELIAYTVAEIEHLIRTRSQDLLRAVHQTKKTFGADTRVVNSEKTNKEEQ